MLQIYEKFNTLMITLILLQWVKDGSKVSSGNSLYIDPAFGITISEHGQFLSVSAAELSHTGDYTCRAINDAGDDSKKYIVNVRGL